jgi:hypothetical protein
MSGFVSLGGGGIIGSGANPNFATTLYTGNGSTQSIVTGKNNAAGSLVWIKRRDIGSTSHGLFDTSRGINKIIRSDTTQAEITGTNDLTAFNSNGFDVGISTTQGINASGGTYVAWSFLEAAGFFDIVSYTGNGSARTIAHNLGIEVGAIIVKNLSATQNWGVYHRMLNGGVNPANYGLFLDVNSAQSISSQFWNDTLPTTSVFSVKEGLTNTSGSNYIAYLFAHNPVQGIACGSFTTDSSGNATVNVGFRPQWVMYKAASANGDWFVFDNKRPEDSYLIANLSSAEGNAGGFDFNSNGFQLAGAPSSFSASHIYIAIR